jgi:hypothetical protein
VVKRGRYGLIVFLAALAAFATAHGAAAEGRSFSPTRKFITWNTDRSLVDIEIVGSTNTLPDLHRLEPDRVLRFRLERAYVNNLNAKEQPGFEFVHFGVDMDTQLPDSLILAVNQTGRFHEDIAGVPKMSLQDWGRRRLHIRLKSDSSAASLKRASNGLEACKGAPQDAQLFVYIWEHQTECRPPLHRNGSRYIAQYDEWLFEVECREESFRGLGCKLRFPFEGFGVELAFHRSHLPNWLAVVDRANAFLKSKKYETAQIR